MSGGGAGRAGGWRGADGASQLARGARCGVWRCGPARARPRRGLRLRAGGRGDRGRGRRLLCERPRRLLSLLSRPAPPAPARLPGAGTVSSVGTAPWGGPGRAPEVRLPRPRDRRGLLHPVCPRPRLPSPRDGVRTVCTDSQGPPDAAASRTGQTSGSAHLCVPGLTIASPRRLPGYTLASPPAYQHSLLPFRVSYGDPILQWSYHTLSLESHLVGSRCSLARPIGPYVAPQIGLHRIR